MRLDVLLRMVEHFIRYILTGSWTSGIVGLVALFTVAFVVGLCLPCATAAERQLATTHFYIRIGPLQFCNKFMKTGEALRHANLAASILKINESAAQPAYPDDI